MYKKVNRFSAIATSLAVVGGVGLSGGAAAADSISLTGPGSQNTILSNTLTETNIRNNNDVRINNTNHQTAITGSAFVGGNNRHENHHHKKHKMVHRKVFREERPVVREERPVFVGNTRGGSAETGNASNFNATQANVSISNNNNVGVGRVASGFGGESSIRETGPRSDNFISTNRVNTFTQTNNNNVDLNNTNNQTAISGNATVSGNTRGGSAETGNASNTNSTDLSVSIHN